MKEIIKKITLALYVLLMMLSLIKIDTYAVSLNQDGLEVNTTMDKEKYESGEQALSKISVKNTNDYDMKNITISINTPKELYSKNENSIDIPLLKSGEYKEFEFIIKKYQTDITDSTEQGNSTNETDSVNQNGQNLDKNDSMNLDKIQSDNNQNLDNKSQLDPVIEIKSDVKTDDSTPIIGWIVLISVSGLAIVLLRKHHKGKQFMILALISTVTLSGLTMGSVHADSSMLEKKMSLTQKLVFDNQSYNMDIDITYFIPNSEVVTKGEVTREEWVTKLVDLFDYKTNLTTYSFADYKDAKNPDKIETAIQYSIVDIEDNESFKPNEYATREFVAYTAVNALRISNTSNGSLNCNDKNSLQYPNEDYLAVQNGMLNLINNQFKPNQYVSDNEVNQVVKVVKEIIGSTKIDETNKDYIDYQDDVKVIEDTFEQTLNNTIILDDDNNIQKGDLVVVNGDKADGIAMKVENVQEQGNQLQIQYSQPSLEDILESLHVEGMADNSNATFTPADGVIVENQSNARSRAKYDSIPLDKELKLKADMSDLNASISLNLNEIQYCFDIEYDNFLDGLQVHDAYLALDTDVNANVTYQGSEDLIEREETEEIEKKIGDINVPLQFGFNASFEVYAVATIDGKIEINVTLANTIGFQYINNNLRLIAETKTDLAEMEISASARFGIQPEVGVEWLGLDIANVNGNIGIGADGSVKNQLVSPYQFCIDANVYLYATVGAELIPDVIDKLKVDQDIFTASNSPLKWNFHFEESGQVEQCTRLINFAGGNGTQENPYQIETAEQLNAVRNDLDANYILINDIDLSCYDNWIPIGTELNPFVGNFDGDNHTIKNMKIYKPFQDLNVEIVGLFGQCFYYNKNIGAIIKNVQMEDVKINIKNSSTRGIYVGTIASNNPKGDIINCEANGSINIDTCSYAYIGGISSNIQNARNCINNVTIKVQAINENDKHDGNVNCGGISSRIYGEAEHCINYGNIYSVGGNFSKNAGICVQNDISVTYCANYGDIEAKTLYDNQVGDGSPFRVEISGISGNNTNKINYCLNYGDLIGMDVLDACKVAGISVGASLIENCFNICKKITSNQEQFRIGGWDIGTKINECYSLDTTLVNGNVPTENIGSNKPNGESMDYDTIKTVVERMGFIVPSE